MRNEPIMSNIANLVLIASIYGNKARKIGNTPLVGSSTTSSLCSDLGSNPTKWMLFTIVRGPTCSFPIPLLPYSVVIPCVIPDTWLQGMPLCLNVELKLTMAAS